jgi:hypothetical protein
MLKYIKMNFNGHKKMDASLMTSFNLSVACRKPRRHGEGHYLPVKLGNKSGPARLRKPGDTGGARASSGNAAASGTG